MTTMTAARHGVPLPRLAEQSGTVICIATGPSLTAADVDRVRGRGAVIVVNDAHLLAPWADVLYSSDRYWYKHHRAVPSFGGLRATIEYSPNRYALDLVKMVPDIYVLRNTGHQGLETDPAGLRTCGQNSGGAALNLAVHLGAKRIILLGYNCGVPGSKRHFFGDHPPNLSNVSNYAGWRAAFESMRQPLIDLGVSVVNCTPNTSLSAFPTATLDQVFQ